MAAPASRWAVSVKSQACVCVSRGIAPTSSAGNRSIEAARSAISPPCEHRHGDPGDQLRRLFEIPRQHRLFGGEAAQALPGKIARRHAMQLHGRTRFRRIEPPAKRRAEGGDAGDTMRRYRRARSRKRPRAARLCSMAALSFSPLSNWQSAPSSCRRPRSVGGIGARHRTARRSPARDAGRPRCRAILPGMSRRQPDPGGPAFDGSG